MSTLQYPSKKWPLPAGPALELAQAAEQRLKQLGWDHGFLQKSAPGVWHFGGTWRLDMRGARPRLETWSWLRRAWEPVRLGVEDGSGRFPTLGWTSLTSPVTLASVLFTTALEDCLSDAANEWEGATGLLSTKADREKAEKALLQRWGFYRGARRRTIREQAERWKRELNAFMGKDFVSAVERIRWGHHLSLGHLLQAWPHRDTVLTIAKTTPRWLPLLNVIALNRWDDPGWQSPQGWLLAAAKVVPDDGGEEAVASPWEQGHRWHRTDLPVFDRMDRARAWLKRTTTQANVEVWRSWSDVELYESALEGWRARPWWPTKLPTKALAELQSIHALHTDSLSVPYSAQKIEAMVEGWVHRYHALAHKKWRLATLAEEWDDLVEELSQPGFSPATWAFLWELPIHHPWVAHAKQQRLARVFPPQPEAVSGRARL